MPHPRIFNVVKLQTAKCMIDTLVEPLNRMGKSVRLAIG